MIHKIKVGDWIYKDLREDTRTFPELIPAAYYSFPSIDKIHLFMFNSNGKTFKQGFCFITEIYNDNKEFKPFEDLLDIKLHENLKF